MVRLPAAGQIARLCAVVLNVTLAMVAFWLWVRLLQGRLMQPLSLQQALVVALVSATLAATVRWCWFSAAARLSWYDALMRWGPTAALAALAVALTLPGTPLQTLLIIWGLSGSEEFAIARLLRSTRGEAPGEYDQPAAVKPHGADGPVLPPEATQRLTRSRTELGQDLLAGSLRARFAPQQRNETLHVAFCPPFARIPELQCRQVSGPTVRIKTTQVLPHGIRLELKLDAALDEEAEVIVEFSAIGKA